MTYLPVNDFSKAQVKSQVNGKMAGYIASFTALHTCCIFQYSMYTIQGDKIYKVHEFAFDHRCFAEAASLAGFERLNNN